MQQKRLPRYTPSKIEPKWQQKWQETGLYKWDKIANGQWSIANSEKETINHKPSTTNKFYTLVELPYPSGDLHIGHWFTFTAPDVLSRFKRMQGKDVFFPMGFDAFGLPAENAAIKRNIHPQDWTMQNITTMTKQFGQMGTMIDWSRVTITCLPEYYKWNQWIFIEMFKKGLAYRSKMLSNWCPVDQTVLANEHVENGKCWRCGAEVVQKDVEQWFLKITAYADKLEWQKDGNGVDWPASVMSAQNEWIGKSNGVKLKFKIENSNKEITVFTTALDTVYGVTFLVIAPENPIVQEILKQVQNDNRRQELLSYIDSAKQKQEQERKENKDKTGIPTGVYVINPFNQEKVPLWIADYVLANYGTGAVMGVPGHDSRDREFAKKFNLPIVPVVKSTNTNEEIKEDGFWDYQNIKLNRQSAVLINSGEFTGLPSDEAKNKMIRFLEEKGWGKRVTTYHLHDWSVSRQRYWGTPVPMIHCPTCGIVPVPEKDLPVVLPRDVDYMPQGKPPLASNEEWLTVTCPQCQGEAKRDAETLDTFFDSSWYYYRYLNPHNEKEAFSSNDVKALMPVDIYFGGGEHTLGHTLYARFFTKFFYDLGLVPFSEFALKRIQHGIVLGPDGNKMSKSKGNVINPDDIVREYGADAVRLYLTFMMPYEATGPWSTTAMYGVYRFLRRVWDMSDQLGDQVDVKKQDLFEMHRTIQRVTTSIEANKLNTAVAAMMEWINYLSKKENVSIAEYEVLLKLLAPFAPHMTEEIWQTLFISATNSQKFVSIHTVAWPVFEEKYLVQDEVKIVIQINGKTRDVMNIASEASKDQEIVKQLVKENEKLKKYFDGKEILSVKYVSGRLINFVLSN